mmetsp:Transcript_182111/g.443107  ORF Transcript_182111/g.443107 Transcript_182111/m.443107 type:complete len:235 (-) Transcript_182111:352-1056(-)
MVTSTPHLRVLVSPSSTARALSTASAPATSFASVTTTASLITSAVTKHTTFPASTRMVTVPILTWLRVLPPQMPTGSSSSRTAWHTISTSSRVAARTLTAATTVSTRTTQMVPMQPTVLRETTWVPHATLEVPASAPAPPTTDRAAPRLDAATTLLPRSRSVETFATSSATRVDSRRPIPCARPSLSIALLPNSSPSARSACRVMVPQPPQPSLTCPMSRLATESASVSRCAPS